MSKTAICLLCGGQSTEHEVSLLSAYNVLAAISKEKYDVHVVGIDKNGSWFLYEDGNFAVNVNDPRAVHLADHGIPVSPVRIDNHPALAVLVYGKAPIYFDIMFPVMHGRNGEDGAIQGLAQLLGCPCVGCNMTSSAICMDKAFAKQILEYEGIRTAPWILVRKGDALPDADETVSKFGLPLFVKPANAGSSVGVVKVTAKEELAAAIATAMQYDERVLIEKGIAGREIECAVMGNNDIFCGKPGEIVPKASFYSYEAKYTDDDGATLLAPAPLTEEEVKKVQTLAAKAYRILGCKGLSRIDFFLMSDGTFILNEINTIPGFTKISMFPRLMGLSGYEYTELVDKLISLAQE